MLAALYGKPDCLSALIGAKADLNLQRKNGETALDVATARGQHACAQLIKEVVQGAGESQG